MGAGGTALKFPLCGGYFNLQRAMGGGGGNTESDNTSRHTITTISKYNTVSRSVKITFNGNIHTYIHMVDPSTAV